MEHIAAIVIGIIGAGGLGSLLAKLVELRHQDRKQDGAYYKGAAAWERRRVFDLQTEIDQLTRRLDSLEAEVRDERLKRAETDEKYLALKEDYAHLQAEHEQLKQDYEMVKADNESLRAQLIELGDQIKVLKTRLNCTEESV